MFKRVESNVQKMPLAHLSRHIWVYINTRVMGDSHRREIGAHAGRVLRLVLEHFSCTKRPISVLASIRR